MKTKHRVPDTQKIVRPPEANVNIKSRLEMTKDEENGEAPQYEMGRIREILVGNTYKELNERIGQSSDQLRDLVLERTDRQEEKLEAFKVESRKERKDLELRFQEERLGYDRQCCSAVSSMADRDIFGASPIGT